MKVRKPLTDEEGEVRELLIEDIRGFRPLAEDIPASLAQKLGVADKKAEGSTAATAEQLLVQSETDARKVAAAHYPSRCCVVCGLQLPTALTVAHLDHHAGNNDPDNVAYLCGTHHSMYDAGLYPIEAVKLLRAHWQKTGGKPDHKPLMIDAGEKAARD